MMRVLRSAILSVKKTIPSSEDVSRCFLSGARTKTEATLGAAPPPSGAHHGMSRGDARSALPHFG
jgi:hypothetical protein